MLYNIFIMNKERTMLMNIEIANRLYELRKKYDLSQEELAAKIGVSRQAVSKWERAEASPDTDNLVLLARLYGVSLDELLRSESVHFPEGGVSLKKEDYSGAPLEMLPENYTEEEIYPAEKIHTPDDKKTAPEKVRRRSFDKSYEKVIGNLEYGLENSMDRLGKKIEKSMDKLSDNMDDLNSKNSGKGLSLLDKTFPLMIGLLFAAMAIIGLAHPGWTVFMLIPLYYTFMSAVKNKNPMIFCYPVLCAFFYFFIGGMIDNFFRSLQDDWYGFMWLVFLTIPLYYTGYFAVKKRNPLIFCFPVLCLIIYLGIGMFTIHFSNRIGEKWFAFAWIIMLAAIAFYYITISHFRSKNKNK